jgi:anti-sigma regulatory factor (Ser/Thr protein kinase)
MSRSFAFKIAAELKQLVAVYDFVRKTAATLELDPSTAYDLQLAIEEAVTNVIRHGYQGQQGEIEIEIEQVGSDIVVYVRDKAPPFDPTTVPAPDLTRPLEEQAHGGRGILLMRQVMDETSYRFTAHGSNELTLIKRGVVQ